MASAQSRSEPVAPSEIEKIREKLEAGFKSLAQVISAARKPLPNQTGDGTYLHYEPDSPDFIQKVESSLRDLKHLGISSVPDILTLLEVQGKTKSGEPWDDKQYLMERLIQTVAKFPDNSATGKKVTDGFLTQLYYDLQHPPISYLGTDYQYRSADGSNNSLMHPDLGKANTPYARTVAPKQMQPGALPDAGDVFDSVMKRKHHEKHPNQISSMLFYLASIIIHDLFRTDHNYFWNSKTSSYLDLSPLYGSNIDEQTVMRTFKDGKIKPDCFSETRLLSFPPGVGCILIMFNRFHNSIVEMLARINQGGQFRRPKGDWPTMAPKDDKYPSDWKNLDENLFQTGRLITCGLYVNMILLDYVRTILNTNKTNSNWALDPRADIKGVPVAAGNQVSAEFNLVYRWHSAISDRDEKWTEALMKEMLKGKDPETIDWHDFVVIAGDFEKSMQEKDPLDRPFAKLQRGSNGKFKDDDLVTILTESIEDCANAFGANRVPAAMRVIEILGIEQARAWNLASLNEFRKYFNLEPHKTFESINPDKYVAEQLKHLYDHPDQVELYPGLVTEAPKEPFVPGAGLTPSFTVSRAVLSDAVALVRGDRFYTIDYHPKKLTNWGFTEASSDVGVDNGCVFYKLFLHSFPRHFDANSVYIHYPMTVPSEMQSVLKKLERVGDYSYDKPGRSGALKVLSSYAAVKAVVSNPEAFKLADTAALEYLLGPAAKNFLQGDGGSKVSESRSIMEKALYVDGKWEKEVREYFEMITAKLLKAKAYKLGETKNQVDIIRDVGNLANVHFVAEIFNLPIKTEERPLGIFTEHEMYLIMAAIYTSTFFDIDPINTYQLRRKTKHATKMLGEIIEANVNEISIGGVLSRLIRAAFSDPTPLKSYGIEMIKRLLKSGKKVHDLVWGEILGTAGAISAFQGQLFAQTLEYYLTEGKAHLPAINKLAKDDSPAAFDKLMRYVLEGVRLGGETGAYRYAAKACEVTDGGRRVQLDAGDKVLLNYRAASRDPNVFPKPDDVVLDRPTESYLALGVGTGLGDQALSRVALTSMFRVVGRLDKLRPGAGAPGKVHKVLAPFPDDGEKPNGPWYHLYLTESHDRLWPFPQTLKVNWD